MVKRIGILFLFSIVGASVMWLYYSAYLNGMFVKWEPRGYPPNKVHKLIGLGYIQTETGDVYQYTTTPNCTENCWIKSNTPDLHNQFQIPLDECAHMLPLLNNYIDSVAVCEIWGNGSSLTIDAIDADGKVYSWKHNYMGGLIDPLLPYIGAIIGLLMGVVFSKSIR